MELEQCTWGQSDKDVDLGRRFLLLGARGFGLLTTFNADDLEDCGQGESGKQGNADLQVRGLLAEIRRQSGAV
jgi:hypothetical protein